MSGATPACVRTGFCCMLIPIAWSPRMLREAHESVVDGKGAAGIRIPEDIEILYPMLLGRCKGKRQMRLHNGHVKWRYVYGPCLNLDWKIEGGKLTAGCAIHDKKPGMCSGFPHYEHGTPHREPVTMGGHEGGENPGTFKGCGYNSDPNAGWDIGTYEGDLIPLDKDEK